jgi:hypothetical protein
VYRLEGDRLCRRGEGRGLLECGPQDCVLVNVPRPGILLHPDAILARLVTRKSLTSPDGKTLNVHGRQVIDAVRLLFSFDQHERLTA